MGMRAAAWEKMHQLRADDLYVVGVPVQITEPDHRNTISDALRDLRKTPSLVVIDTLSRSMAGRDENSAEDMSAFVGSVDLLRDDLKCAVIIVHHENKDGSIRGSTALPGAADTMFNLTKDENSQYTTLKTDKMKEAEEPPEMTFYPTPVTVELPEGPPRTSIVLGDDTWTPEIYARAKELDGPAPLSPFKSSNGGVSHLHPVPDLPEEPASSDKPADDGLGDFLDED
jgi:hypothetical protein